MQNKKNEALRLERRQEVASVVQAIISDRSIRFGCCLQECQIATDCLSAGVWLLFLMQSYNLGIDSVILNSEYD